MGDSPQNKGNERGWRPHTNSEYQAEVNINKNVKLGIAQEQEPYNPNSIHGEQEEGLGPNLE